MAEALDNNPERAKNPPKLWLPFPMLYQSQETHDLVQIKEKKGFSPPHQRIKW